MVTTWEEAAARERSRLTEPHIAKKWATILAIVRARVTPGQSEADVWRLRKTDHAFAKTICAKSVYDGKWHKDPVFADVLGRVQSLAEGWETAESLRKLREEREREQTAWREKMKTLSTKGAQRLETMLDWPLERSEVIQDTHEDGRPRTIIVLNPAGWSYGNIPSLLREVDKTGRLALDMDTDRTRELSWEDELIPLIRDRKIDFADLVQELRSEQLARDFFIKAGVEPR